MAPHLGGAIDAPGAVERYASRFSRTHQRMLAEKLGLGQLESDEPLVTAMFGLFDDAEVDWTLFFRCLMRVPIDAATWREPSEARAADWMREAHYDSGTLTGTRLRSLVGFLADWAERSRREDPAARLERMGRANPAYVPRNWLLQNAIDALTSGDPGELVRLFDVIRSPYEERAENERFAEKRPDWARHKVGCSMLSCSS
jgi:serine/tyrosine/threonine adenylyltransferase